MMKDREKLQFVRVSKRVGEYLLFYISISLQNALKTIFVLKTSNLSLKIKKCQILLTKIFSNYIISSTLKRE